MCRSDRPQIVHNARQWPVGTRGLIHATFRPLPLLVILSFLILLVACQQVDDFEITYDPADLVFSGERALALQSEFVGLFPDRDSGQPNNQLAAAWLAQRMTDFGWQCAIDHWQVVNDDRDLPLRNVVCTLPGESAQTIVVGAHHDQSPYTVQGADNGASGIGIWLHLAEILAAERPSPYTLTFLSSDGTVYGLLGAQRYVRTHDDLNQIIASITLDNMGMALYDGLVLSPTGQYRGYGPLWLQQLIQAAARAAELQWIPESPPLADQLLTQSVPLALMDQGPFVAVGVPSVGLRGSIPVELRALLGQTRFTPADTMAMQSAQTLHQGGRAVEALIRQLNTMQERPRETGYYLYDQENNRVLRGLALWLPLLTFATLFLVAAVWGSRKGAKGRFGFYEALKAALPHFFGLCLPLLGSVLLLYVFVRIGLMTEYAAYPASPKDAALTNPRWLAVILWLIGLWELLQFGRQLAGLYLVGRPAPSFAQVRTLALTIVGLAAFYIVILNPFSLLLIAPTILWLFIGRRTGWARLLDWLLFLAGGSVVFGLIYYLGFQILNIDLAILWYLMMMVSIGSISIPTALVLVAILAAGLSLVVKPPIGRRRTLEAKQATAAAE